MRLFKQWIVWRLEDTGAKKPTKIPYSPNSGRLASVTDPSTWATFEEAIQAASTTNWYSGIGFVLTDADPFAFIDLDDTEDVEAKDRQVKIYEEFDSYAERSPSGTGLHILVKGALPSGRKRASIEVYSSARYMTMTGDVFREGQIKDYNDLLNVLWEQMGQGKNNVQYYMGLDPEKETDLEVYNRACQAANGEKFYDLYNGNWETYYHSQSEADLALVDIIAFYSPNRVQISRIFRASALGQREKAKRDDYVNYMLNKCFDRMLPPVDVDSLRNKLNEIIENRKKEELEQAASLRNRIESQFSNEVPVDAPKPTSSIYQVPPGLVGEIAQFIYSQAPRPVPEIALAGAIGVMSGIVGRGYNVSSTGLNQYTLLLAPTGTGKEAIAGGIDKLFAKVLKTVPAASEFIGPAEIASSQAVIKFMSKGPTSFVSMVGEFGLYLQQMASHNAPPHLMGLRRFLLDAYGKSGKGKVLRPSIYSDKDKNTNCILSPSFSILGESTPEKFYEGLHEGLISEGLLPRFTIIEYHGDRPDFNPNHANVKPDDALVEKFASLCANALSLNSKGEVAEVAFSEEANRAFMQFNAHCDLQIKGSSEIKRQLWNRAHLKAMKLAALVAIGCNPIFPKIELDVATWALNIVSADVKNLLKKFNAGEIGVDNDETKQLAKVAAVCREYVLAGWHDVSKYCAEGQSVLHSEKIIPYSYIQRKLAAVAIFRKDRMGSSNSIKRALTTLIERGDLQALSPATLSKEYKTTAKAYMISNMQAFDL